MEPTFFETQQDFRKWLEKNHTKEQALLVGYYKVGSGKLSMSWSQSVDEALCFGWIDGVRKSIDGDSYCIRFTPRRANSIWSPINIEKIKVLTEAGLMKPAGLKAFEFFNEAKSAFYIRRKETIELDTILENQFKENKKAWDYFVAQAPSYKKVMIHWIMSAKQEKTKQARLAKTMLFSEQEKRVL